MLLPQREREREPREQRRDFLFLFFCVRLFLLLWSTTSQRFPSSSPSSSRVCGVSDFVEEAEKRQKRED